MAKYPGRCPAHYTMNIYTGCPQGCVYCVEQPRHEAESRLSSAVDTLLERMHAENTAKHPVYLSPFTEPYQALEAKENTTGRIIAHLAAEDLPFFVITKETLVWRDRACFYHRDNAFIAVSINSLDDALAARMEPGASPPSARKALVEDLCALKKVRVVVKIDPIICGITDGMRLNALLDWLIQVRPYAVTAETLRLNADMLRRMKPSLSTAEWDTLQQYYPQPGAFIVHPDINLRMELLGSIATRLAAAGIRASFCRASLPEVLTPHDCRGGYA